MKQIFSSLAGRLDDLIRHKSVLGRHQWLRDLLRKPYYRLVNFHGQGLRLNLGGCVPVRVPPEYASKLMEEYEREEFAQINEWCKKNPGGLFVDVGCSIGYMSCAALHASPTVEVVAIDSDVSSLKCAEKVCTYADKTRLHLLRGMISAQSPRADGWKTIAGETAELLNSTGGGNPGSHHYVTLDDTNAAKNVPQFRLDDLLASEISSRRVMLVKCDVEGAELEVLKGASRLMAECRPPVLLSVHPYFLPKLGATPDDVRKLLADCGYTVTWLAKDHDEHWLCTGNAG